MLSLAHVILTGNVGCDGERGLQRRSNDGTDTSTATRKYRHLNLTI